MNKKLLIAIGAATMMLLVGAAAGLAVGEESRPDVGAQVAGQTKGLCRFGFDTQTVTNIPPDDTTSDNVPANTVTINKPCQGAVSGLWVGEVSTTGAGDFIHMDMRATCTGTGGFTNPCTVGQQVSGNPGHTFVKNTQSEVQTHSVQMVWTGLKRGIWTFEVLPGGNNAANIEFRTFTVEAFQRA